MRRLLERYRTIVVILTVIVVPLFFYRANAADPSDATVIDRIVLVASAPLMKVMSRAITAVSDAWYRYVDVVDARKENGELRRRLFRAERERDERASLELENTRLRRLLEIKERNPKFSTLQATVIAAGTSPLSRTVEIDRGALDGVTRGMPILADEGLVGMVMRVGWTSSEVLLIADEKMTVWVAVIRSRARGRLRGNGLWPGFGLELTEVLRSDDVRVGDRIATSGLGGVFPGGIPVGEVTEVRTPTRAQHRVAHVEPYVDFARLENVIVLLTGPKEDPVTTPEPLRPPTLRAGRHGGAEARELDAAIEASDGGAPGSLDGGDGGRIAGAAPDGGGSRDEPRGEGAGGGAGVGGPPRLSGAGSPSEAANVADGGRDGGPG